MKNKIRLFYVSFFILVSLITDENYSQWNHTGPEGGEVRAFCVSGNHLFSAPFSGGIYRSTDNGVNWTMVTNGLTEININVSALIADGTNIFAGTWGNGVFLSTNFGNNWVEANTPLTANKAVEAFAIKGTSIFMASRTGGIVRTTDLGVSWEQRNNGLPTDIRDITVMGQNIYATGTLKVYKSTDDGMNWTEASNGTPVELVDPCINVKDNILLLGTYGYGVYRSTNNGDNWTEANVGLSSTACIRDFAVIDNNIFVATRGLGVFLSTNDGTSWTSASSGITTNRIESMIVNTNQDIFAGTQSNGIFRSTDNGSIWVLSSNRFNASIVTTYVTFSGGTGGERLLAATNGAGIYQSTDNGLTWNFLGLGEEWVTGLAVIDSTIFASTMGHGIFRSTDSGLNWNQSGLANQMLHTLYSHGNVLYAGAAFFGGAYRSTDFGDTWSSIASLAFKWIMTFTANENFIFAGTPYGGAFRSSDNGITFTPINTGLDNRVVKLAITSRGLFAGTGDPNGISAAGVFRSDNNGDSWMPVNNGLPANLMVWSLTSFGDNLFASSSSSGQNKISDIYFTSNGGDSWSTVSAGVISNYLQALFIYNTNIFAGSLGSGSWWRPLSEMIPELLPLIPSNLTAIADTFKVTLSWQDNSDNEEGFVIERKDGDSTSANPFMIIDTVAANVTAFVDYGLSANSTYTYQVYAYNEFGNSGNSNIAQTTTIIPVELTSFSALANSDDIELKWTTATETNNQGFQIERALSSTVPEWKNIGYAAGFGTTTEPKSYSFIDSKVSSGTYIYRLKQIDLDGTYKYSNEVSVEVTLPLEYSLDQNYPNPFNPSTTIKYSIPEDGFVKLSVYNMLGEEVSTLVNGNQEAGRYELSFNASELSSGVYVYRLEAPNYTSSKKLILLR